MPTSCRTALTLFSMFSAVALACVALAADGDSSSVDQSNWPRWRGPNEDGHYAETLPTTWDSSSIAWKSPLPGIGESSPVIWGERIFLTSALENGQQRVVFCVDRKSGKILWQQIAWTGQPESIHKMNSWASPTCVTDGEMVYAFFGRGGLHAYTVDGKHAWSRDLGQFQSPWGVAACPVLVGDLVIQNCDADSDAYIAGLDKKTGKTVWRTDRPNNRGWSTPVLVHANGRQELAVNSHTGVRAYDPKTGKELWFCKSFAPRGEPTVTPGFGMLFTVNGLAGDLYAIKTGGDGNVTASHMAWHTPRKGARDTPSPILVDQFLTVMDMKGVATCYEATTGKELWKDRVGGNFSASPIAAGGYIYFLSENGETVVMKPGPTMDIVSRNVLSNAADDELFRASLTPCNGQVLIRSNQVLYCIGKGK